MKIPKWAEILFNKVLDDYEMEKPELVWRRYHKRKYNLRPKENGEEQLFVKPKSMYSSGHCSWKSQKIVITAGASRKDQKLCLLHEIAHWMTPYQKHSSIFWDKAFELYRKYKIPMRYATIRESLYMRGAASAYRRNVRSIKK